MATIVSRASKGSPLTFTELDQNFININSELVTASAALFPTTVKAEIKKGFWYDPSDLTTMFQDVNGRTPVTAAGQTVKLILDKSKGLARGPNLVVNGTFDADTDWTKGANWTISGGVATSNGSSGTLQAAVTPLTAGTWYEATITITSYTSGSVSFPYDGTGAVNTTNAVGTYTYLFLADRTNLYINSTSFNGSIDNVIVKPLYGNHAQNSTGVTLQQDVNGEYYLSFDGSTNSLTLTDNTVLDGGFNVVAALRYDSTGTTDMRVLSKWDDTNEGVAIGPYLANGHYSRAVVRAASAPYLDTSDMSGYSILKRQDNVTTGSATWKMRTYDYNGTTAFVNAAISESDIYGMHYNGVTKTSTQIVNAGFTPWIIKTTDASISEQVTQFTVQPGDASPDGYRSQIDGYPFERFKDYCYDMEFKLDAAWDFNMVNGDGLFWQVKGSPRAGQYGHAAMSIGLNGSNLYFSVLYPQNAANATTWPTSVSWTGSDYVSQTFPSKAITAGDYHKIRVKFFADDRPTKFGGQGYVKIWVDDVLWIDYKGPNLHPDQDPSAQNGEHRCDFGWYNWGGQPSANRVIYFRKSQLTVPTPQDKYTILSSGGNGAADTNIVVASQWNLESDQKMASHVNTKKSGFVDGPDVTVNRTDTALSLGRDATGRFFKGRIYQIIGVGNYVQENVLRDMITYAAYTSKVTL